MKANLVQPFPFPEVHKEDNYERWCIFMQHYLVAQDLWDVILSSEMPDGEDPREWIKKNALALYAIKISCGAEKFDQIKEINSAKDAWKALADLHKQPNEDGNRDTGIKTVERKQAGILLKEIRKGDSDTVKTLSATHPSCFARALENDSTALHVAITAGKLELAKVLISVISEAGELETQNKSGKTVLHLAACKGSREIVECLVAKNKKLLEIPDCEKKIPLVLACATHHKCLTLYLYSVTPIEILDPVNGDHGFFLLIECLRNYMFEIGLDLLRKFPDLTFHKSSLERTPIILELVQILSSLFVGIWYKCLPFWECPRMVYISFCKVPIIEDLLVGDKWKTLPEKPGWSLAYNLKYYRAYAHEMVHFICEQLSTLEGDQLIRSGAVEATFKAIELGYLEFVKQITEANPDIVWSHEPEHSRDMLMYAVARRQKEIARFLYGLNVWRNMTEFTTDEDQNNMLHLAAKFRPSSPPTHHFFDPVLQMQSEAMWFKAVTHIVPTFYEGQRNKEGETPSEVFRREHQDLLKEAQRWVKDTVNFAAIIGTLIVGIMFAAGITVPGGNNDADGLPIFSKSGLFRLFITWNLFSLYLAAVSVVLFLDIHKSSLTEEDFLSGFWTAKLATSFCFLFLSIGMTLFLSFASIRLVDRELIWPLNITILIAFGCPYAYIFLKNLLPLYKTLIPYFFSNFIFENVPHPASIYM